MQATIGPIEGLVEDRFNIYVISSTSEHTHDAVGASLQMLRSAHNKDLYQIWAWFL